MGWSTVFVGASYRGESAWKSRSFNSPAWIYDLGLFWTISWSDYRSQRAVLCREDQRFWDFWEGSLPVKPGLGSVSGLSRRFGGSVVLLIVEVSVKVSVETARGQTGCLESWSGL